MADAVLQDAVRQREEFLSRGDFVGFYRWVSGMAYDELDMSESPVLRGFQPQYLAGKRVFLKTSVKSEEITFSEDRERYSSLAKIILPWFDGGITPEKIRKRLFKARKLGFNIIPYGEFKVDELMKYFDKVKMETGCLAGVYCPETLGKITGYNRSMRYVR